MQNAHYFLNEECKILKECDVVFRWAKSFIKNSLLNNCILDVRAPSDERARPSDGLANADQVGRCEFARQG